MRRLTQILWLAISAFVFSATNGSTADYRKSGEFEATVIYREFDLYEVMLSEVPGLKWIKTMACVEILMLEDVLVETWTDGGEIIGGFFYVVDAGKPRRDWDDCIITGFYNSKPSD